MFRAFAFSLVILFVMGCSNTATYSASMKENENRNAGSHTDDSCDFPAVEKEGVITRDLEQITCVLNNDINGIFSIYQRALRKNSDLSGEIVLRFEISPEGDVVNIGSSKSTVNDSRFERKIQLRVKRIKFPKMKGVHWEGELPIYFLPP